jgi:hypothetical protein
MTVENTLGNGKVELAYDSDLSEQFMHLDDRVDRLIKLSENLSATCRELSVRLAPPVSEPDSEMQYTGGTPHEIIEAMLEALRFNGIVKVEGRGWEVRIGITAPQPFRLLRDAIGYRIERGLSPIPRDGGTADA